MQIGGTYAFLEIWYVLRSAGLSNLVSDLQFLDRLVHFAFVGLKLGKIHVTLQKVGGAVGSAGFENGQGIGQSLHTSCVGFFAGLAGGVQIMVPAFRLWISDKGPVRLN